MEKIKKKETRILFQRYITTEDERINHKDINALRCQLVNDHNILHM